ncbi:unnamed protein product [Pleuronectes platessa]|uniref:Uncharacterized protein n=1 Tax=Pleuronectes platessa TaxID=8262 RepID=A0A9N7TS89_PLEPL|nr:unnamed protein product [Pleuronectes platessa]
MSGRAGQAVVKQGLGYSSPTAVQKLWFPGASELVSGRQTRELTGKRLREKGRAATALLFEFTVNTAVVLGCCAVCGNSAGNGSQTRGKDPLGVVARYRRRDMRAQSLASCTSSPCPPYLSPSPDHFLLSLKPGVFLLPLLDRIPHILKMHCQDLWKDQLRRGCHNELTAEDSAPSPLLDSFSSLSATALCHSYLPELSVWFLMWNCACFPIRLQFEVKLQRAPRKTFSNAQLATKTGARPKGLAYFQKGRRFEFDQQQSASLPCQLSGPLPLMVARPIVSATHYSGRVLTNLLPLNGWLEVAVGQRHSQVNHRARAESRTIERSYGLFPVTEGCLLLGLTVPLLRTEAAVPACQAVEVGQCSVTQWL